MVEIDWIARVGKRSLVDTVLALKEAGLDSCPGGGAEIFARRVRDVICRNKISGERWLEVAKVCHESGVRTNATILYGSVETIEERVDHLVRLRDLQDETGGFTGLIPLAFHPENTPLAHLPETSGQLDLRVIAASRLILDNFPHVKAYWIQIGTKLAQVALSFGADDLVGTLVEETITHAAGARTEIGMTRQAFEEMIRETGREPFERDSEYRRVVRNAA
jgi:aminodeoxyfutalosine synthase